MKRAFTLIEMMVVVAVLAVIMVVVVSTMLTSFKAKNRTDVSQVLEENGSFAVNEIRNNLLNSNGKGVSCGVGSSVTFINRQDGNEISLACIENGAIASVSGTLTTNLTVGVSASGCDTFISCDTLPSGEVSAANVGFTLSAGVPGSGEENFMVRSFQIKVTVRN